jgi:hypothetical protein
MSRLGVVAVAGAVCLGIFGAALWWALGADAADAWVCFAPAALAVALGATSQAERRQYVACLFAATMFLSIGLLMWAAWRLPVRMLSSFPFT